MLRPVLSLLSNARFTAIVPAVTDTCILYVVALVVFGLSRNDIPDETCNPD